MSSRQQVQVACQRCRQRRAKCSGEQPCLRCEQRGETCEYRKREWLSKGDLRAEIGRLRQGIDKSTSSRGQDPRNDSGADESALLSWIKEVKSPEDGPSGSLSAGDAKAFSGDSAPGGACASPILTSTSVSSSSCFEQLLSWRSCHPTFDQRNQETSNSTRRAGRELILPSAPLDAYGKSTDMDPWTQVGWTRAHIRHLFDVLVTWDSISLCILSKKQFLQDYETDLTYDTAMTFQLANPQILFVKMFQLTEWVYKVIVAHQKDSLSNQGKVLATYTKCLGWYRDVFELVGDGGSRSPFILFIHMYYHFCLLCAFRPFIGCNFTDTESQPHEMCGQAVQSILALAQSYDDLFTLRRVSALIPYFVCASGLFSLAIEDSGSKMDFIHLRPQGAVISEIPPPLLTNLGEPASETSLSRVRVSTVVQARLLLSKMGESHPAAALAAAKLIESSQSWRSKEVNFS
ncbi:hypothetical protein ARSEF1564_005827 [Beauveria bassiana]